MRLACRAGRKQRLGADLVPLWIVPRQVATCILSTHTEDPQVARNRAQEGRVAEIRAVKSRVAEIRAVKSRVTEIRAEKFQVSEVRAAKHRVAEIRAVNYRVAESRAENFLSIIHYQVVDGPASRSSTDLRAPQAAPRAALPRLPPSR